MDVTLYVLLPVGAFFVGLALLMYSILLKLHEQQRVRIDQIEALTTQIQTQIQSLVDTVSRQRRNLTNIDDRLDRMGRDLHELLRRFLPPAFEDRYQQQQIAALQNMMANALDRMPTAAGIILPQTVTGHAESSGSDSLTPWRVSMETRVPMETPKQTMTPDQACEAGDTHRPARRILKLDNGDANAPS